MIQEEVVPERTEVMAPPMAPPPVETEIDEIVHIAEQMPRFPGCESMPAEERKAYSEKPLLDFIYKNIRYPSMAQVNGVEGTCVIRFVVGKDGTIRKTEILRDHEPGLGQEALRVVNLMNEMPERWTAGKQNGRSFSVQFNLPITFKLRQEHAQVCYGPYLIMLWGHED
ncbi:MAG: energy transducer TonB [Saprospiraceae bacterium]|nr:energy transducer TonB [Saprospiraceae bacterium]